MPIEILMPALSPTMEVGNLTKWYVSEGDNVSPGDVIAEIETDKATMEVEAVDEGTVGKILVLEGSEDVPVNQLIALLLEEGEDATSLEGAVTAKPVTAATSVAISLPTPDTPVTPALSLASRKNEGTGVFASPLARRLAASNNLDLALIAGSGPRGRIIKRDIETALQAGTGKTAPPTVAKSPTQAVSAMPDDQVTALFEEGSYEVLPHSAMRKIVAERLLQSKQTIPHFYLTIDCNIDKLMALRKEINTQTPKDTEGIPAYKISVNDFIIKALALALQRVPMANATWTNSARLVHKHSDIGVAVAIPDGLFTPIIRKAEQKSLSAISSEMKDLAARAREKKLAPHEYQGGVSAVSNLGMFGIREFTAVINPPHATILAVGAGQPRAVVIDGAVQTAMMMAVTLSCDHRVVDGALGAELLGAFSGYIENPMGMLV